MAEFRFTQSFLSNLLAVEASCSSQEIEALDAALARIVSARQLSGVLRMRVQPNVTTYYYNAPPFWIHFRESSDAEIDFLNVWLRRF